MAKHDITRHQATKLYCPFCGKQMVIELPNVEEDNAGWQHLCIACLHGFYGSGASMNVLDMDDTYFLHALYVSEFSREEQADD